MTAMAATNTLPTAVPIEIDTFLPLVVLICST